MQQTPKPEAQFPSAMPPEFPHSSALRQIPFMEDVDVDEATTHSSLGNYRRRNHGQFWKVKIISELGIYLNKGTIRI